MGRAVGTLTLFYGQNRLGQPTVDRIFDRKEKLFSSISSFYKGFSIITSFRDFSSNYKLTFYDVHK